MAHLIRTNGTQEDLIGQGVGRTLTLRQLQAAVGGSIEIVRLQVLDKLLVVHDEGALIPLPVSLTATVLARLGGLPHTIHGDVVLAEPWEVP